MRYKLKEHRLKNGAACQLRSPLPSDAAAILQLMRITSDETGFMARYSDELKMPLQSEERFLEATLHSPGDLMVCAAVDGAIVANAGISPIAPRERYRHRATFGISVLKEYWGLGIGSLLLAAIISGAREMGLEMLELEVVCTNERAIALYEKFGFRRYGTRPHSFKYRDGSYADEYLMLLELKALETEMQS